MNAYQTGEPAPRIEIPEYAALEAGQKTRVAAVRQKRDSSIVVGVMAGLTGAPFKTFTGDIRYGGYSEAPWAENVARKYKTEHRTIEIAPSFVRGLPMVVEKLDEPSDPLSLCQYHLAERTRREVKVALGGEANLLASRVQLREDSGRADEDRALDSRFLRGVDDGVRVAEAEGGNVDQRVHAVHRSG